MNSFFYLDKQGAQQGPVPADALLNNGVTENTLVWCAGMENWQPAGGVEELRGFFKNAPQADAVPPAVPTAAPEGAEAQPEASAEQPQTAAAQPKTTAQEAIPVCPDNYLVWSILTTVCCCVPLGIVAIVKSSKVNNLFLLGNYEAAYKASADAKKWCIIAAVCGLISGLVYGGIQFALVTSGMI